MTKVVDDELLATKVDGFTWSVAHAGRVATVGNKRVSVNKLLEHPEEKRIVNPPS
jgi:hypothetical protein